MNKSITIGQIYKKEIETKYGRKWKKSFKNTEDGEWYSCFDAAWNQDMVEGGTYDIIVQEREYQGKTYYDIKNPNPNFFGGGGGADLSKVLSELGEIKSILLAEIAEINSILKEIYVSTTVAEPSDLKRSMDSFKDDDEVPF